MTIPVMIARTFGVMYHMSRISYISCQYQACSAKYIGTFKPKPIFWHVTNILVATTNIWLLMLPIHMLEQGKIRLLAVRTSYFVRGYACSVMQGGKSPTTSPRYTAFSSHQMARGKIFGFPSTVNCANQDSRCEYLEDTY